MTINMVLYCVAITLQEWYMRMMENRNDKYKGMDVASSKMLVKYSENHLKRQLITRNLLFKSLNI